MSKRLYIVLGYVFLALGLIGVFLPVMPTAPFVIVAAFCFKRGSTRLHRWLLSQPRLGPMIQEWEQHRVIRPRAKILAVTLISFSIGLMAWYPGIPVWAKALAIATMLGVIVFILKCPSHPPHS